jgi:hypothetical protein
MTGEKQMRYQDHITDATREAAKEAFKYAKAVPADKLEWRPMDIGRTVLDLCQELAMCPTWAFEIIEGKEGPKWDEESMAAVKKEQQQWKTAEDCEAEFGRRMDKLAGLYASISNERLKETKWLPFDGGRDFTVAEMMDYPRWNCTYHLGQIAYIQTLYGDRDMH